MASYDDFWLTTEDGLRLYARDYPNPDSPLTVLCLHGLTRNSADFAELAEALAPTCRVIVLDQRGRGRSDYDANPANYQIPTYVRDTLTLLDTLQLERVALIGTSMGGLISMTLESLQPQRVGGIVLNDVGPVVEPAGIARIQSYVGKGGNLSSWGDAVRVTRENNRIAFPDFGDADWDAFARRMYHLDADGIPQSTYDAAIAQPLNADTSTAVPPDLWPLFDSVAELPMLVIRGAHSDILSAATVAEMARRHPGLRHVEVANRGHAPMLDEPEALAAIQAFLEDVSRKVGA
jgi:pimeloyl-ACP methyl ester carboxylesterase